MLTINYPLSAYLIDFPKPHEGRRKSGKTKMSISDNMTSIYGSIIIMHNQLHNMYNLITTLITLQFAISIVIVTAGRNLVEGNIDYM